MKVEEICMSSDGQTDDEWNMFHSETSWNDQSTSQSGDLRGGNVIN